MTLKFTIFETKMGSFGLLALGDSVLRTALPMTGRDSVERTLLFQIRGAVEDSHIFPELQRDIIRYFEGEKVEFSEEIPLVLDVLTDFSRDILLACRQIPYGQTRSYSEIAELAGHLNAARAVGNALGNNPIPLIIPCHRVIKSDGDTGGFMKNRPGGTNLKKQMLQIERFCLNH